MSGSKTERKKKTVKVEKSEPIMIDKPEKKKTPSAKKPSAKQIEARKKFKLMIENAKKIKKANPDKKWQNCLKEACKC